VYQLFSGESIYVCEIKIQYLASAKWGESLKIISEPIEKRVTSGVFSQEMIKLDGSKVCEAIVKWVFVDAKGKPVRIPEKYNIEALNSHG